MATDPPGKSERCIWSLLSSCGRNVPSVRVRPMCSTVASPMTGGRSGHVRMWVVVGHGELERPLPPGSGCHICCCWFAKPAAELAAGGPRPTYSEGALTLALSSLLLLGSCPNPSILGTSSKLGHTQLAFLLVSSWSPHLARTAAPCPLPKPPSTASVPVSPVTQHILLCCLSVGILPPTES